MSKKTTNIFGAVLTSPRPAQEGFLQNRGWVRLVDRADVWIDTRARGEQLHDVYLFRFALERAVAAEYFRRKAAEAREASTHRNQAWLDMAQAEGATS